MSTTLTTTRRPVLVARWHLVSDARGRARPQMRWTVQAPASSDDAPTMTLAA
jgi:hypothetical protein